MYGTSNMETYITICKIDSQREFAVCIRELKPGLWNSLEDWGGREVGGRVKREGSFVHQWLIHADVWQKPTQYYKANILQLNINKRRKKDSPQLRRRQRKNFSPLECEAPHGLFTLLGLHLPSTQAFLPTMLPNGFQVLWPRSGSHPREPQLSCLPLEAKTRRAQRQWRRFWLWHRFFLARINVTSSASNSSAFCPNFLSVNTYQSIWVVLHINSDSCMLRGGEDSKDGRGKRIVMAMRLFRSSGKC